MSGIRIFGALIVFCLAQLATAAPAAADGGVISKKTKAAFKPAAKNPSGVMNSGVNARGQYDRARDSLLSIATSEAIRSFQTFHAVCEGKILVRVAEKSFYQFSGPKPAIEVIGINPIYENDLLNGMLWRGKIEAALGRSARAISLTADGQRESGDWKDAAEAEFDFSFKDSWQAEKAPMVYIDGAWLSLRPGVTCGDAGFQPASQP